MNPCRLKYQMSNIVNMKRPLADKRPFGPFFNNEFEEQLSKSDTCNVQLIIPDMNIRNVTEQMSGDHMGVEKIHEDRLGVSVDVAVIDGNTIITYGDEIYVSTIYFGITDTLGEGPDDIYVTSNTGDMVLEVSDTYESVKGSIKVLNSFLGEMEEKAAERDMDVESNDNTTIPSNEELKDEMQKMLDELAEGISSISSYSVYWDDEGYRAEFRWENNQMNLILATDIMTEIAEIPEEFNGASRDLQTASALVKCYK